MTVIVTTKNYTKKYNNIYSVTKDNGNFILAYLWNQQPPIIISGKDWPHVICLNED